MSTFIAGRIIKAHENGLQAAKDKYIAYFIATALYRKYQNEVNTILETDGYADCIVAL